MHLSLACQNPYGKSELHPCLKAFGAGEDTARKIVRGVVHAIQKGNLFIVAFHLHMLSVRHQRAAEAFAIAIPSSEFIVVWKTLQFFHNVCVCSV